MFNYHCLNPISDVGLEEFTEEYVPVSGPEKADALWCAALSCMRWSLEKN